MPLHILAVLKSLGRLDSDSAPTPVLSAWNGSGAKLYRTWSGNMSAKNIHNRVSHELAILQKALEAAGKSTKEIVWLQKELCVEMVIWNSCQAMKVLKTHGFFEHAGVVGSLKSKIAVQVTHVKWFQLRSFSWLKGSFLAEAITSQLPMTWKNGL